MEETDVEARTPIVYFVEYVTGLPVPVASSEDVPISRRHDYVNLPDYGTAFVALNTVELE